MLNICKVIIKACGCGLLVMLCLDTYTTVGWCMYVFMYDGFLICWVWAGDIMIKDDLRLERKDRSLNWKQTHCILMFAREEIWMERFVTGGMVDGLSAIYTTLEWPPSPKINIYDLN